MKTTFPANRLKHLLPKFDFSFGHQKLSPFTTFSSKLFFKGSLYFILLLFISFYNIFLLYHIQQFDLFTSLFISSPNLMTFSVCLLSLRLIFCLCFYHVTLFLCFCVCFFIFLNFFLTPTQQSNVCVSYN